MTSTWRVVVVGETHEVEVLDRGEGERLRYATVYSADGGLTRAPAATARQALAILADSLGWDIIEIVAPGEKTSSERAAALIAQRYLLVTAVREEWKARDELPPGFDADYASDDDRRAVGAMRDAVDAAVARTESLLTGTPVAMVRAEVVRAYRAAEETMALVIADDHRRDTYHEWAKRHGAAMDAVDAARTALDAALAAAGGV